LEMEQVDSPAKLELQRLEEVFGDHRSAASARNGDVAKVPPGRDRLGHGVYPGRDLLAGVVAAVIRDAAGSEHPMPFERDREGQVIRGGVGPAVWYEQLAHRDRGQWLVAER